MNSVRYQQPDFLLLKTSIEFQAHKPRPDMTTLDIEAPLIFHRMALRVTQSVTNQIAYICQFPLITP